MTGFLMTYEVITPASAAHGDVEDAGILYPSITLREALDELSSAKHVEANEWPVTCPRWVTGYRTYEDHQSGETGNLSLHFPEHLTPSTRRRIARLLGVQA